MIGRLLACLAGVTAIILFLWWSNGDEIREEWGEFKAAWNMGESADPYRRPNAEEERAKEIREYWKF